MTTLSQWVSGQWASREAASGNSSISLIIKLSIIYINLLLCGRNFNGAAAAVPPLSLSLSRFYISDLSHNAHYHDDVVLISSVPCCLLACSRCCCCCCLAWPIINQLERKRGSSTRTVRLSLALCGCCCCPSLRAAWGAVINYASFVFYRQFSVLYAYEKLHINWKHLIIPIYILIKILYIKLGERSQLSGAPNEPFPLTLL